ncbi:MAG: SDR family NAD(P)-dependent oxidoreductase [Halioglobus sp.]|nr:SDR family NAD(P)-dependent oxidoreductase [Halioglobus sp.]
MITLHEKIEVNRPVEEAFAYLADFRTSEQWDSTVISATKRSSGPIGSGTRFEVICRQPLGSLSFAYTLTHHEPGTLLKLHGRGRFFDVDDEIRFAETATGTLIDYRATFTFKGRLDALADRFRTGLQQMGYDSVQGLKRALEDNFPAPVLSRSGRWRQRLVIPALADFTRFGYTKGKKRWLPVSRWMGKKHVVITGASAGLGLAAAQRLAELGAELTLVIRNENKALELKQAIERESGNSRIHIEIADLSLMADVDRLVRRLVLSGKPIDVLVNNAGALFNPREETSEGLERSFALLLLSPFRLTEGLKPLLATAGQARVINVVSGGMYSQRLDLQRLEAPPDSYSGSVAYARAKRGLMIVTQLWAQAWKGDNIVVNAMHPGWARTPGVESALPTFNRLTGPLLRTPEQGADTIVWLATASEAARVTGELFLDRAPRTTHLMASTRETPRERSALMEALKTYRAGPSDPALAAIAS